MAHGCQDADISRASILSLHCPPSKKASLTKICEFTQGRDVEYLHLQVWALQDTRNEFSGGGGHRKAGAQESVQMPILFTEPQSRIVFKSRKNGECCCSLCAGKTNKQKKQQRQKPCFSMGQRVDNVYQLQIEEKSGTFLSLGNLILVP